MTKKYALLGLLILTLFWSSCGGISLSSRRTQYDAQPTAAMKNDFKQAEQHYQRKAYSQALQAYHTFLQNHPYTKLSDRALFRMGQIHLRQGNPQQAVAPLSQAADGVYDPQITPEVIYHLMVANDRAGRSSAAWSVLRKVNWKATRAKERLKLASYGIKVGTQSQRSSEDLAPLYLEIIDAYVVLIRTPAGAPNWVVVRGDALRWVRRWAQTSAGNLARVESLSKRFSGKASGAFVLYKLGKQSYDQGNQVAARHYYERYLSSYPKHEFVDDARTRLSELGKKIETSTSDLIPIGVILPFSGKYGRYGKAVMRGIECAAGVMGPCDSDVPIRLVIRDTESESDKATAAFRDMLHKEKVRAVIGPLAQVEVDAVAREAELNQVPLIALSQKKDIGESGSYVFRNFLTVEDQVNTLVEHICSTELREIAVLYPDSNVGKAHKTAFETAFKACGGEIKAIHGYAANGSNFQDAIRGLKFSISKHALGEKSGFKALFIPDSYRNLSKIIPLLNYHNIKDALLFGTAGWNNPKLIEEHPEVMARAVFVGGFYADSNSGPTSKFSRTYTQTYGQDPSFLEAYGYDSLQLIKRALRNKSSSSRADIKHFLSTVSRFPGATGAITIDKFGDAKRRLFLLTVRDGKIEELH